jgi:VanZ family protein
LAVVITGKLSEFAWLAAFLFISIVSLLPSGAALDINIWDKALHAGGYGVLFFLALCTRYWPAHRKGVLIFHVAMGIILEAMQTQVPGRFFELLDIFANLSGLLIAYGAFNLLKRISG